MKQIIAFAKLDFSSVDVSIVSMEENANFVFNAYRSQSCATEFKIARVTRMKQLVDARLIARTVNKKSDKN